MSLKLWTVNYRDFFENHKESLGCTIDGNTAILPEIKLILMCNGKIQTYYRGQTTITFSANNSFSVSTNNTHDYNFIKDLLCGSIDNNYGKIIQYNNVHSNHKTLTDEPKFMSVPFEQTEKCILKYGIDYYKYLLIPISDNSNILEQYLKVLKYNKHLETSKADIDKIDTEIEEKHLVLKNSEEEIEPEHFLNNICPICLSKFYIIIDNIVSLSCGHCFCKKCITSCAKNECPTCNKAFTKTSIDVNRLVRDMCIKDERVVIYKNIQALKEKKKLICNTEKPNNDNPPTKIKIREYFKEQYGNLDLKEILIDLFFE
jgi:hypothetical protein